MVGDSLVQMLSGIIAQAPGLLVWIVGGIVALATWGKHPGVSRLTLAAMAIHVVSYLASTAFYAVVPQSDFFQGLEGNQVRTFYTAMSFVWSVIHAAANVLLLFAIFKWRDDARQYGLPIG